MEYVSIPGVERKLTRVALGTWAIGGWMWGGADEKQSIDTIHAALDKGVNVIDTAPVYGFGASEEIVGKAVSRYSGEKPVLATKVAIGFDPDQNKVWRDSTPERIRKEIEDSLRRLQVEHIDIYQVHWPDPLVPFEDTAEEMLMLQKEGKIGAIGVSNYSPEQMDAFRKKAPLATSQPPYNIFERQIEDDVLPYCLENGVATLTYGALCRGLLSGKMTRDREFTGDDLRNVDPKFQGERFDQYLEAAQKLDDFIREKHGKRVIHLAIRFLLDKGASIPLWGGRRPDQMDPLPEMFGWSLDDEDMAEIDRILDETIKDPVGPEFMAPPDKNGDVPEK
jgi:aryl-alcohol dehydrogenase-like predicted oxidoreductase